tara:strand:+ start:4893 stop:5405 length:513 start_codon:yes stop_codon:yes gene_type:complete
MDTLQNFKKIDPKRAGYLQFGLRSMIVLQVLGYFLLFSGVLGGWPPNMPGENGFYAKMAERLVKPPKFDEMPVQVHKEKKRSPFSLNSLLGKLQKDLMQAGVKAGVAILLVSVELSLRLASVSTGLIIILLGGWVRRRIRNWLIRIKMKTTEEKIEILEKRISELEKTKL